MSIHSAQLNSPSTSSSPIKLCNMPQVSYALVEFSVTYARYHCYYLVYDQLLPSSHSPCHFSDDCTALSAEACCGGPNNCQFSRGARAVAFHGTCTVRLYICSLGASPAECSSLHCNKALNHSFDCSLSQLYHCPQAVRKGGKLRHIPL